METQPTLAEIAARIERAMQRMDQALAGIAPAQMLKARLPGDRSVKDVLAHLTWWDQWLLITLPPGQGDAQPQINLPLADQIPATDSWADELNDKVYHYNLARDLDTIQTEFAATRGLLLQRVAQLSESGLYDPDGLSARIGQPVAPLILGIYEHYEEHAHEFEQLRGQLG
jgi:hypothetical protein